MMLRRCLLLSPLLLLALALARPAGAGAPLTERTRELISTYRQARGAAAMDSVRRELDAAADSLGAAGNDTLAAEALQHAGIVLFRTGALEEADARWRRGLALARASGDRATEAALLNAVAVGVSAAGEPEQGAALFAQLVELRRELGDVRGEGVTLSNLARARLNLFRLPEADVALLRAMECHRQTGNHSGLAAGYLQRSEILLELGETGAALALADSAVAVARRHGLDRELAAALIDRGRIRKHQGDAGAGLADVEEGLALLEGFPGNPAADNARINQGLCLIELGRPKDALAPLRAAEAARAGRGDERGALIARAGAGLALVEGGELAAALPFLEETIARLEELRADLEKETSRVGAFRLAGSAYADLARCHLEQGRPERAWEVAERGRAARLRALLATRPDSTRTGQGASTVPLAELQRRLGEIDAQLLHFGDLSGSLRPTFLVRPDSLVAMLVEEPGTVGEDISTAGYLIGQGADDELVRPVLARLAAALLHPVEAGLDPGRRRLLLSLPRGLAGLPVEELPLASGEDVLIGRWTVAEVPSATTLVQLLDREPGPGELLALADPRIEPEEEEEFALAARFRGAAAIPLPEARQEARHAAGSRGRLVLGEDAGEERLRGEAARRAGALHLALHAVIDPLHPEASALLLAGRGREAALTAGEVEELELGADLVTLSGCRTGEGLPLLGEGTLGLCRSFLVAGARTVVLSRWDVEDAAARRFMEAFYDALREGAPRDMALRRARHQLAGEGYPLRDRAAFFLAGVPSGPVGAVSPAGPPGLKAGRWLLAGLLLLALVGLARRRPTRG